MATKKVTITLTPEQEKLAQEISLEVLGKKTVSGLFQFWINEYEKNKAKKRLKVS